MALDRDIDVLGQQPLLAVLPREALRLLAFAAETRFLRAGDILFRKGDPADGGYVVASGLIALDPRDDGSPAIEFAGPGCLLGETALFAAVQRPATAVARETTTVMKLPRALMLRVLGEFPEGAEALRVLMAERVQAFNRDLAKVRLSLTAIGG